MIEDKEFLFNERRHELDERKRVAAALGVHQMREGRDIDALTVECVRGEFLDVMDC